MKTQIIISDQTNPFLNIAVESHLLSIDEEDTVVMYLWRNRRTVVIGQHQNPYAECNVELLEGEGGHLVRRRTGGGAVFHDDGNLNFSFIAPACLYSQERQFAVLQRAVAHYGLRTEVSGRNDVLCYDHEGTPRKFSGNAFAKGQRMRLHHGTILIKSNLDDLQRYLRVKPTKLHKHGVASVKSRVVNLAELAVVTADNIVPHLIEAFEEVYGERAERIDFHAVAAHPEVQRIRQEYESDEWRFGRWRSFHAQRTQQFAWGLVEMSLDIDEHRHTIQHIALATDSLNTELAPLAEQLLTGASTLEPPPLPHPAPEGLEDIVGMIY